MSDRPFLKPYSVITAGDMSGNLTSSATIIKQLTYVSYILSWTGTPVGQFTVQVSNDYSIDAQGNVMNAGNWLNVPLSTSTLAVGAPGTGFVDLDGIGAFAIRLIYTAGSSVGTLDVIITGKAA